jgi:hypothetical protein
MPTRGIPWEQLPLPHERYRPKVAQPEKEEVKIPEIIPVERDLVKDLSNIARRAAFGLVCGTITGMCLGSGTAQTVCFVGNLRCIHVM